MRTTLFAALVLLAACERTAPPAQTEAPDAAPQAVVCNTVRPDMTRQITIAAPSAVTAAADLRGGRIAPGTYDLVGATRIGAATGWQGSRAAALDVSEAAEGGVVFNWASAAEGGSVDSWTANFTEAPAPRLTYTCGRMGEVAADFSADANTLRLQITDGASGALDLAFQRRA